MNKTEVALVYLIKHEPIIYNMFNSNYGNVEMTEKAWAKIANIMNLSVDECKLKWDIIKHIPFDDYLKEMSQTTL